jgi:hypothetical protein
MNTILFKNIDLKFQLLLKYKLNYIETKLKNIHDQRS